MSIEKENMQKFKKKSAREKLNAWILSSPSEVMVLSLAEIADKFYYSEAMIIKGIKELGYEGLKDLKKHLYILEKKMAIEQNNNYYEDLLLQSLMATERRITDDKTIETMINICGGKKIIFQGFGAANRIAVDYASILESKNIFAKSVEFKEELVPHRGDILIVLTTRGSSTITIEVITYAKMLGMKVVVITGQDSMLIDDVDLMIKYVYFYNNKDDIGERTIILRYILSKFVSCLKVSHI